MITAIIPTRESERALVPTLAALVPAVASGLLGDVIVADANSRDATREVADVAGCGFMASEASLGERLAAAARTAKGNWLLFLPAGSVLEGDWIAAVERFTAGPQDRAATFRPAGADDMSRPAFAELLAMLRAAIGGTPKPEHGLLIAHRVYDELGGHGPGEGADAELIRRLGRKRIAVLRAGVAVRRDT